MWTTVKCIAFSDFFLIIFIFCINFITIAEMRLRNLNDEKAVYREYREIMQKKIVKTKKNEILECPRKFYKIKRKISLYDS